MSGAERTTVLDRAGSEEVRRELETFVLIAMALAGAQMGNIQILTAGKSTLRIVASAGFEAPFLTHFASVTPFSDLACAIAITSSQPIIVPDVGQSSIFAGTDLLGVMLAAEVRAVISVPIIDSAQDLLGVLSVHWTEPQADLAVPYEFEPLIRQLAAYLQSDA